MITQENFIEELPDDIYEKLPLEFDTVEIKWIFLSLNNIKLLGNSNITEITMEAYGKSEVVITKNNIIIYLDKDEIINIYYKDMKNIESREDHSNIELNNNVGLTIYWK